MGGKVRYLEKGRKGFLFLSYEREIFHFRCLYSWHKESVSHRICHPSHLNSRGLRVNCQKNHKENKFHNIYFILFLFLAGSQRDSKAQSKVHGMEEDPFSTSLTDKAKRPFQGLSSPAWALKWIGWALRFSKMLQRLWSKSMCLCFC